MTTDLNKQFKKLRSELHSSYEKDGTYDRMWSRVSVAISSRADESVEPATTLDYYWWMLMRSMSTPIATGVAVVLIAFGGWMTTVNASQSLPGEALYSVKLATEKAQLKLASLEHKAVLHTEFAGRRLDEAEALGASTDPLKRGYIGSTLEAYKTQVALAGEDVRQLMIERNDEAMEVAVAVDIKMTELNIEIEDRAQGTSEAILLIEEARDTTRAVLGGVVDVMIENHEVSAGYKATAEIERSFKNKLVAVKNKQAMVLGRLAVIDSVIDSNEGLEITGIAQLAFSASEVTSFVRTASDLSVAGGYRAAFDELRSADDRLATVEDRIVGIEIQITDYFAQLSEPVLEELDETDVGVVSSTDPQLAEDD